MKTHTTTLFAALTFCTAAHASSEPQYSPSGGATAYAARVKPGKEKELDATIAKLTPELRQHFGSAGATGLRFYTESIGSDRILIAICDIRQDSVPDAVWPSASSDAALKPWLDELQASLAPHPRAQETASPWVRCETICELRPRVPAATRAPSSPAWSVAITGLNPAKEADYRNYHAHVWPGVIDAIGAAMVPRFDIFLIEFGEQPYLIYQMEYVGSDFKSDMAGMGKNPVNVRWWKWTDACQQPLPSAATRKEIWEPMESIPATAP